MLIEDLSELLLPNALYVVLFFSLLAVLAFRRRGGGLWRLRHPLLLAVAWSYCFSTPGVANSLLTLLERDYPPAPSATPERDVQPAAQPEDVDGPLILVLSSAECAIQGDRYVVRPDLPGWERIGAAVRLWRQIGGQLLFVGGPTPDGRTSAAERMASAAVLSGVPASAVKTETKSRNTYENLLFSRNELASRRSGAWLVSSAMHLHRAMAVGRKLGLKLRPYPCDWRAIRLQHWYGWLPNTGAPAMFLAPLHEVMGLAYYHLRGYTD